MFERKESAGALKDRTADWLRQHRHGLIERGKTLLIVVLFCSACFFADRSGILGQSGLSDLSGRVAAWLNREETTASVPGSRDYAAAARPQVLTVSPDAGTRYGVAFNASSEEVYERFSPYLGEALGTAGTPEPVTRDVWQSALAGAGVYFDFMEPQSMTCLAAWQGTAMPGLTADLSVRRLFLSVGEAGVTLYFAEDGGTLYRCGTSLDASIVTARMGLYQSNGAYFAFERSEADGLDPDTVVVPGAAEVRTVSVSAGASVLTAEGVLKLFGMNDITATSYPETNGMTVYLDGGSTLRMSADGVIDFERETGVPSSEGDLRGVSGMPDVADGLYRMLLELSGAGGECASLRLTKAVYEPRQDEYTVEFAYFIDGMQVCYAPGPAAEFTVTGGVLTQAQVRLRQYQFTGETQTPLPARQAAALVAASGGTDPVRVYQDQGDRVTVSWRMG